jgi:hypothetical protein
MARRRIVMLATLTDGPIRVHDSCPPWHGLFLFPEWKNVNSEVLLGFAHHATRITPESRHAADAYEELAWREGR